jgi:hypothetical protein
VAIKGKSRSRGRRLVAASPRPQLMVRKKPFWAKWWFWSIIGGVAVVLILFLVTNSVHKGNQRKRHERLAGAVQTFGGLIESKFPPSAHALGPTQFQMFPTLQADLDKLDKNQVTNRVAAATAKNFGAAAKQSGDAMAAIQVSKVIPQEFVSTELDLLDAQFLMVQSFKTDEVIAGLMTAATQVTGAQRTAILDQAKLLASQAAAQFDLGYSKLVNIRLKLGIQTIAPGLGASPPAGVGGGP